MKKKFYLSVIAVVFGFLALNAQTFEKGSGVLNFTLGFGSGYYTGSWYKTSVPPIALSYEMGVVDNVLEKGTIGIGGYLGYSAYKWAYSGTDYGWKISNFVIGPRGTFHYPLVDKLDTYAGLMIAYRVVSEKEYGTALLGNVYSGSSSGLVTSGFVGARYYFNEKFGGVAELGWGVAYFNIGLALKLK